MASGIDGPGVTSTNSHLHNPASAVDRGMAKPVKFQVSFDAGMVYTPASVSRSMQDIPVVTVSESMDSHLSFSNLMLRQNAELEPPKAERRGSLIPAPSTRAAGRGFLRKGSCISEEFDKVFDDGTGSPTYNDPPNLQIDFGDPDITSEVSTYPDQRFTDSDYSSHRRTQRQHSKPLAAHLPRQEIKSLKSRAAAGSPEKERTSRRRHRSSSSSSSSQGGNSKSPATSDLLPTQRKVKRKEKKKKKVVRKSLTGPLRQRTLSIPEEEEGDEEFQEYPGNLNEESEEEEEEDEEESDLNKEPKEERPDDDDDNNGGDSPSGTDAKDKDRKDSPKGTGFSQGDATDGGDGNQALMKGETQQKPSHLKALVSILTKSSPEGRRKSKNATFQLGDDQSIGRSDDEKMEKEKKKKKKRKKHHHHHHHRSTMSQRRASGIQLKEMDEQMKEERRRKHLSGDGDIESHSHRYDVHPGIRKHLLHRPVQKRRAKPETSKVPTDRKPHEVFVELDELVSGEWKETARWIKFEEDVEESQKWSKPRVASLSFHSLLELRRSIEKGAVILDLDNDNLTDIANTVVERMVVSNQIREEDRGSVLRVLLSKHKHLPGEKGLSYTLSQASFSNLFSPSSTNLNKEDEVSVRFSVSGASTETRLPLLDGHSSDVEAGRSASMSRVASSAAAKELKIMKKIPQDAEASAVLVGSLEYLEQPTLAFVRLAAGVDLDNVVALPIPVRFIFVLLGPTCDDFDYHEIGRSISTLMADEEFHVAAYQADSRGDLLRAINEFLDDSIVLPPGQLENPELLRNINLYQEHLAQRKKRAQKAIEEKKEEPEGKPENPLQRTKKCFGGLIRDVKRRYPRYLSDITDAFNTQCLAAFIFIYFAALSPAITFGGLLGEKTGGLMGVSEMVLSCCFCGCTMALFSGQPLLIVGATGPLLVFEEAVYAFCLANGLPFLATRFWIGMWICIISIVTVAFEGSFLIRFVSRFTQEIFAVLIALIFIFETFKKLIKTYQQHPLMLSYCFDENLTDYNNVTANLTQSFANSTLPDEDLTLDQPNTALLSTILMFGTYMIAMQLRSFKNSKFLRSSVRRTIGDFGVPIAIAIMVLLDYLVKETYTQKLNIPDGFSPTNASARGWLIDPLGTASDPMPVWMIFASCLPAFLVFILIFMESHITELIISNKDRCLKKGTGFHLNTVILGIVNAVVSVFGLPWVCAATIRSVTHTNSLTVMSQTQAPGERPKIVATREQRVTCFAVNAVLGLSILMGPLLRNIPIAVLFGIFLYMGVGSLNGVQMVDRIKLLFMPTKHYPDYNYVRIVRPIKMHVFTVVELLCLAVLWVVKSTAASIAFPFFLLMTVPVRTLLLPRFFSKKELSELDNDGSSTVDSDDFEEDLNSPD